VYVRIEHQGFGNLPNAVNGISSKPTRWILKETPINSISQSIVNWWHPLSRKREKGVNSSIEIELE
jgi:hypothetical protein